LLWLLTLLPLCGWCRATWCRRNWPEDVRTSPPTI